MTTDGLQNSPSNTPQDARAGKYCPQCRAMNRREQAVCAHCGHRFRTGAEPLANVPPTGEPDLLNRTMQFTLPPRLASAASSPPPARIPARIVFGLRRDTSKIALLTALVVIALGTAAGWYGFSSRRSQPDMPTGIWETTLAGRGSVTARLRFVLEDGGRGEFSWRETGAEPGTGTAPSGRMPLHWHLIAGGSLLELTLASPPGSDAVSGTLASLFSSHPWPWRADRARHQIVLGKLILREAR